MAKSKLPSKIEKLFTGTVEINGNIKRINLERGLSVNRAEKFFVYISNTSGDRDPDFPVPVDCPSWDKVFSFLSKIGLKPIPNSNNQGEIIFQAETDFPNLPQRQAIGVKIYKMTNNDYECVLEKQFNESSQTINGSPITISYSASVASATLEGIFEAIEKLKGRIATALSSNSFYTDNPDF
ncbi:hypothetical protein [Porphyromonas gingivalis]|uniref:hypothetical protein n=1 Tax=Porphyromonas gingivalis TaxID=837 RepID=UPI0007178C86|nr:hypothetical protein [Porphyromonas gingivalis]ALO29247.1 hypothetical protein PGS_00004910 [Porphyromonas gingivalis A7A1-28]SJL30011.1 hypothetical protein PGIN_A7A1-28_01235 [Porphyromonas gingivalis]